MARTIWWIFQKTGKIVGPTTTIMVWVHGNERTWITLLNTLLDQIKISKWKVYFVYWNLLAIIQNQRCIEENLNRCFIKDYYSDSYESIRAKIIMQYLDQSDYLLDIHNTLNPLNSIPFIINEHKEFDQIFPVRYSISWIDNLHIWWSDGYMNSIGKVWICLEAGSIYDKDAKYIATQSLLNFLKFTWNISGEVIKYNNIEKIHFNTIYKNKSKKFSYTKKFKDFETIKQDEIIWIDWWNKIICSQNSKILFPYFPNKIGEECFILWEKIN